MITLEQDRLHFRFPEVHPDAQLEVAFQRTLRVPDDNLEYPLPAGIGHFPLRHVDDFGAKVPEQWRKHGGVMLPMYQAEAMWISFDGTYPMAIKVAAGKINAVSGDPYVPQLEDNPQDYLVVPLQPWLDGFSVRKGSVRQFVAMPLGEGFTAEEQLTGQATHGGIQIVCYPMLPAAYDRLQQSRANEMRRHSVGMVCCEMRDDMGLSPGGMIRQQIQSDPYGLNAWDSTISSRCFVHLANSQAWAAVTGEATPPSPITKRAYERLGIPWFDYYFSDDQALAGSTKLAGLDSVAAKTIKAGHLVGDLAEPIHVGHTIDLSHIKKVREGHF